MTSTVELGSRARISAHTIRDYILDPACTAPGDVPWCAEAITPQWLTPILCADIPDACITAIAVDDASSGSSVRKRIEVTYNAAGEKANLRTKFFAKTTPTVRTRLTSGPSAGQESRFFASVRPEIDIETPVHCFSAHSRISGRSIHLFEDLVDTSAATFCDYETSFTREEIERVFELLATLHGHFFDHPKLSDELSWIPGYEVFFDALAAIGSRDGHDRAMIEARHLIPEPVFAARDRLWPAAIDGLEPHRAGPRTVIHSDVHPGNWYLTREDRPGLCDWQCIAQGHWARDVAYAMSSMLTVEQRRAWEHELLAHYLAALRRAGGPDVGFDDGHEHYRRQLPAALLMWTPTLCHPPTMPDMQPEDVSLAMIQRITTAIGDLGIPQ